MTSISLGDPANHTLADATLIQANNALLEGVINGNIDNGNIVAGANIDGAKLLNASVTSAKLAAGVSGPPGAELVYAQITTPGTSTTTTDATAIITAGSFTFDGNPVVAHFSTPGTLNSGAGQSNIFILWDNTAAAEVGRLGIFNHPAANQEYGPLKYEYRFTPVAGARIYSVRLAVSGGTGTVDAGAGGVNNSLPASLRIVKV